MTKQGVIDYVVFRSVKKSKVTFHIQIDLSITGAAPVMYINGQYRKNGYVISGFNETIIRAWAPSNPGDSKCNS